MLKYYLNLWDVSKGEMSAATLWSDSVSGGRPLSWPKWTKLAAPWAETQGMEGIGGDGQALQRRNGLLPGCTHPPCSPSIPGMQIWVRIG